MSYFEAFFTAFTNWQFLLYNAVGVFVGIYLGVIPGLSVTMAVSLLISFTFSWELYPALALMVGIWSGGVMGGSRTAILLNIPGGPANVATSLDGYPLAQKGEAGIAMGLATVESVAGGFIGIIALLVAAPILSRISTMFAARDYLLLAAMGLFLAGSLGRGSLVKALITAFLGVAIGLIGLDLVTAQPRMTFGNPILLGGVHFIIPMIGLFGLSEAFVQLKTKAKPVRQNIARVIPDMKLFFKMLPLAIKSSIIGVIVGILPGTGGDIAALVAYDQAKRSVKKPSRPFGEGAYEGVVAPEAANNACVGGAAIPMMTLGIPGDSVTAVLLGALIIHGVRPGPLLMMEQPEFFYTFLGFLVVANFFVLIFGMSGIRMLSKLVEIPKVVIIPIIIILSIIGSYAINSSVIDIYIMFFFGILGYLLKMYDFPVSTMVLGVVLGPIIDTNWRRAVDTSHGEVSTFISGFFTNPISFALLLFIAFMVLPAKLRAAAVEVASTPFRRIVTAIKKNQ